MLKALSTLAAAAALAGCLDAKKSFDEFGARVVDGNTSMPDRPNLTSIPDVNGHFLLAARPNLPEDKIIQLVVDFTLTANADGTAELSFAATALKEPSQPQPRTPSAGPPAAPQFTATNMQVALDGTFLVPLKGTLPGDANPVIPGNTAIVDGQQHGEIRTKDLLCGTLTGTAGPLSLDGSTFAAIRIPPGQIGVDLPAPVFACPP